MVIVLIIENSAQILQTVTGQFRKTGEDFLQLEKAFDHTYLAFSTEDCSIQSDNVYLAEINT